MGAKPPWRGDDDLTAGTVCYCARNAKRDHIQAINNVYARPYPKSTVRTGCWRPLKAPRNFGISRKPLLRNWLLWLGCDGDLNVGALLELDIVTMFVS
jgi:hypothetical protein